LPPRVRLGGSAALKGRSFLTLDEDVLKVSSAKETVPKRQPAKAAFQGFGKGFLNSSKAKSRGLCAPESGSLQARVVPGGGEASSSSSSSCQPEVSAARASESNPGDVVSSTPCEASSGQAAVQTNRSEKRQLFLGAADVEMRVTSDVTAFARRIIPGCGDLGVSTIREEEEEELLEQEGAPQMTVSELANQLFGSGDDPAGLNDIESLGGESMGDRTESTTTPSPKGTSLGGGEGTSLGGGAPSELSEPCTEDGGDPSAPTAGIRGLLRRRAPASPPSQRDSGQQAPAAPRDESEELLNLWMKQRW